MSQTIAAHFDGRFIVPDEPVELPVGRPLRVRVEDASETPRFAAFLGFAADLTGAPPDLSLCHDDYLADKAGR